MSELEILPIGAVIISTQTGATLMRTANGWMRTPSGAVCACFAVAEDLFAEAGRNLT